jgi:TRAP-type mannitol/chloroaromatic compound transport system permease small subunit
MLGLSLSSGRLHRIDRRDEAKGIGMSGLLAFSRLIDSVNERVGRAMSWAILAAVAVSAINALVRYTFHMSSNAWLELQWYLFSAVFLLGAAYTFKQNEHIRIDIVSSRLSPRARHIIDVVGHLFFLMPFAALLIWLGIPNAWKAFSSGSQFTMAQFQFLAAVAVLLGLAWILIFHVPKMKSAEGRNPWLTPAALVLTGLIVADIWLIRELARPIMRFWEQSSSAGGLPTWPARFLIPLGFLALFMQGVSELIKRVAVMRGLIPDPHARKSAHGSVE